MSRIAPDLEALPGAEIVLPGIEDLKGGRDTVDAAAVRVASRRLGAAGLELPPGAPRSGAPGHHLFRLLQAETSDPHSRYNAILRRVDGFARALESARAR